MKRVGWFRKLVKWLFVTLPVLILWIFISHFLNSQVPADSNGNVLNNAGFEQEDKGLPAAWTFEKKVRGKGSVSLSKRYVHSGQFSLAVAPNERNKPWDLPHDPLGVGQGFRAGALRGTKLYVSGWLAAEGGAAAVINVVALGGKVPGIVELKQTSEKTGPVFREDVLMVPDDAKIIVVVCIAQGTAGTAYFDDVFVSSRIPDSWGGGAAVKTPAPTDAPGAPLAAKVVVQADHDIRKIPRTLYGMNIEWIWDGNGIWNTGTQSLDPELISLTRDLGATLLRFPGGIFSDFYHWRDGVGPRNNRPRTASMPGDKSGSVHTFGTDEALAFADQTGSRLLITVNAGTGTAQEAADWVRYVNRAGRRVEYWEVGNELYVKMGHEAFSASTMPPEEYARKFIEFAAAMRAADPGIKIGAIGDENYGATSPRGYGDWTSKVLSIAGSHMDFLAIHNGYAPVLVKDKGQSLRRVYAAMLAAPVQVRESLETASRKIAALGPERDAHIRLAVTEWGPYFQMSPGERFVDHVKTLGSALYVASAMKAFLESPKMDVATGFKLVDELYQGWIGKRDGRWIPKAPYYALQLYTKHFGSVLVSSSTEAPGYDSQPAGLVDALSNVPYLDVVSSRSEDGRKLFLMAVNKHFDSPVEARVSVTGRRPATRGTAWTLNGTGIDANTGTQLFQARGVRWARQASDSENPRFESGAPDQVAVTSKEVGGLGASFTYTFPAHSVTALEIPLQ
jgi:alpha-N-arabinofuranosidase